MCIKKLLRLVLYPLLVASVLTIPVVSLPNSKFKVMAQTKTLPSIYSGTWDGNGIQDNGSKWSILIKLASGSSIGSVVGTIAYPSLRCGGKLILTDIGSNYIKLYENLTFGKNSCINSGTIILQPTSNAYLKYLWFYPQGSHGANGIVRQQQPNNVTPSNIYQMQRLFRNTFIPRRY